MDICLGGSRALRLCAYTLPLGKERHLGRGPGPPRYPPATPAHPPSPTTAHYSCLRHRCLSQGAGSPPTAHTRRLRATRGQLPPGEQAAHFRGWFWGGCGRAYLPSLFALTSAFRRRALGDALNSTGTQTASAALVSGARTGAFSAAGACLPTPPPPMLRAALTRLTSGRHSPFLALLRLLYRHLFGYSSRSLSLVRNGVDKRAKE